MNEATRKMVLESVADLKTLAKNLGGPKPSNLVSELLDLDDYPDFDNDPGVNYHIGALWGATRALGLTDPAQVIRMAEQHVNTVSDRKKG